MTIQKVAPLGEELVRRGICTQASVDRALTLQKAERDKGNKIALGRILVKIGATDERTINQVVEQQRAKSVKPINSTEELHSRFGEITVHDTAFDGTELVTNGAREHIVVGLSEDQKPVIFLSTESRNEHVSDIKKTIALVKKAFPKSQYNHEHITPPVKVSAGMIEIIRDSKTQVSRSDKDFTDAERAFRRIIFDAYERDTSDIHFYRMQGRCTVKYRIHGSIRQVEEMSAENADTIISVGFDSLGEGGTQTGWDKKKAQRRRIRMPVNEHVTLDLRYEHQPGDNGSYHCVIRLLANDQREINTVKKLTSLGFSAKQEKLVKGALMRSSGATLIAGPTGSGKSTTIGQLIKWMYKANDGDINILTVEAPIERELPAFQASVSDDDEAGEKEYAQAIKGTLRRDPDFLMVGEIRDPHSAAAVVNGVQSGHPLISTVHAQSAIEIVERMAGPGMKVPPQTLGSPSFISALIYQMLLPQLDDHTKIELRSAEQMEKYLDKDLVHRLMQVAENLDEATICVRNRESVDNPEGTSGMTVCAEVIIPDEVMLKHFRNLEIAEARRHWRNQGKRSRQNRDLDNQVVGMSAQDHAIQKMLRGMIDPRDVEAYFGFLTMQSIMDDGIIEEDEAQDLFSDDDTQDESDASLFEEDPMMVTGAADHEPATTN